MGIKNAAFRAALLIIEFPHFRFGIFGILFLSFEFPIELPCQKRSIESTRSNGNHARYSSAPAGFLRESVRFGEERVPQGLDLLVVSLNALAERLLAQSDVVEAPVLDAAVAVIHVQLVVLLLFSHHNAQVLFLHEEAGQEFHQRFLNPLMSEQDEENQYQ